MEEIGDVIEIPGEVIFEWKIKDIFTLSEEKNRSFISPTFCFSGASWKIKICPNGQSQRELDGWMGLYLVRISSGSPVTVICSFGFKSVDRNTVSNYNFTENFGIKYLQKGFPEFIKISEIMGKKSELAPEDDLTIVCTLKNTEPNVVANSLFYRFRKIIWNLRKIHEEGKRADFKLKFKDGHINAHRMILETRSPVFEAMLNHDTKENQSGEVYIDDVDKSTMENLLYYIYTGEMERVTTENALSIYVAADKYDIKEMKQLCLEFILFKLSKEWVLDVMKFADFYQEKELSRRAREYFKENAEEILESENWKKFSKENHNLGLELLGSLVKELLPRKKEVQMKQISGNQL